MIDLFVIFNKGGIVLWSYIQNGSAELLVQCVNAFIRNVILQDRLALCGTYIPPNESELQMEYKLDNEFDFVLIAGYQKVLKLSYVDKFLSAIQLEIRDKFKTEMMLMEKIQSLGFLEKGGFMSLVRAVEEECDALANSKVKTMRTFQESQKSKKSVSSMIINKEDQTNKKAPLPTMTEPLQKSQHKSPRPYAAKKKNKDAKSPKANKEVGKKPRIWELGGGSKDLAELDRTQPSQREQNFTANTDIIGTMRGNIKSLASEPQSQSASKDSSSKFFGLFKGIVGGKVLTEEDVVPIIEKMKDHLISKNVAADVSQKLCESVSTKIVGKTLGSFTTVSSSVKQALEESILTLLQPKRQIDVLREAIDANKQGKPYVIAFCGVNGVGKSTNLAKICFWLMENDNRVLIAACDTFRAGAVEQLRTHVRHLNSLHPEPAGSNTAKVLLYEKGYGKDAAGVAAEAISFAKEQKFNIVLIDTAGRMQDNLPLMKALTKLIRINNPHLVLFVGEALVGNEAVDQLVKFNRALADYSEEAHPRLIDGIVLTKFDTVDDKVGAAVSMSYITGQPIVFVGTGQTYTDLRSLDAHSILNALIK